MTTKHQQPSSEGSNIDNIPDLFPPLKNLKEEYNLTYCLITMPLLSVEERNVPLA